MILGLAFMLQVGSMTPGGSDLARRSAADGSPAPITVLAPRCGPADRGEVVVCARRPDRFRLPLPVDLPASDRRGGASAVEAITPAGRCGIFAGERRCGKAEAAEYGYGDGRDPITALGAVAGALFDPD